MTDENKKEVRGTIDANGARPGSRSRPASTWPSRKCSVSRWSSVVTATSSTQPQPCDPDRHGMAVRQAAEPHASSSGHAPSATEVVIDVPRPPRESLRSATPIRVVGKTGSVEYRLAGVATYAGKKDAAGAQVVAFAPDTAATGARYSPVATTPSGRREPGVSQTTRGEQHHGRAAQRHARGHHRCRRRPPTHGRPRERSSRS